MAIWLNLWSFGYIFPVLVCLGQGISGNPAIRSTILCFTYAPPGVDINRLAKTPILTQTTAIKVQTINHDIVFHIKLPIFSPNCVKNCRN
jgi:hypothetical protein